MKKLIINEKLSGIRIDKALMETKDFLSRTEIQRLLENGQMLVNNKKEKASYKTKMGDVITYEKIIKDEEKLIAEDLPLDVIYEDNDILVINKAKGMVVHPGNGNYSGTLANAIMSYSKDSLSGIGGKLRPGIVHRLDKDTSGVLVIAKNDKAHIRLSEQIKDRKITKTYLALVRGIVKENEATINMPIGRNKKDRLKMDVTKDGKEAITHFRVIKRYKDFTLLEVRIETGRTHQIRVHLSEIGYPVLGDEVYSNGKNSLNIKGQALHAYKLKIHHPITEKEMEFIAPPPKYFIDVIGEDIKL